MLLLCQGLSFDIFFSRTVDFALFMVRTSTQLPAELLFHFTLVLNGEIIQIQISLKISQISRLFYANSFERGRGVVGVDVVFSALIQQNFLASKILLVYFMVITFLVNKLENINFPPLQTERKVQEHLPNCKKRRLKCSS